MKNYYYFIVVLIFSTFWSVALKAQTEDANVKAFREIVRKTSEDSLTITFENKINQLKSSQVSDEQMLLYLILQYEVGDSLKNADLKSSASNQLVSYRKLLKKRNLFEYLISAGNYQNNFGNYVKGIELYYDAVRIAEDLNNDTLKAKIFLKMGITYKKMKNYELSKNYIKSAIEINTMLNDSGQLASNYMSIGNTFKGAKNYDTASYYYNKSLEIGNILGVDRTIAGNYNNLGNVSRIQKKLNVAVDYYLKAVSINKKIDNKKSLSHNYNNLGLTYKLLKKYKKALNYYQESLILKDQLGLHESKISTKDNISELYYLLKNYELAYETLSESEALTEQYANQKKISLAATLEAKFQNEEKEIILSKLKSEQKLQSIMLSSQEKTFKLQAIVKEERKKLEFVLLFAIGLLLLGILVFWRNSIRKKKHLNILFQKNTQIKNVNTDLQKAQDVLTEKNNEITDSITYAKRIQAAILPSQKSLKSTLEDAFVLYLPKDIVAGDFYWTEQVGNTVLFAVADCTGHGVPGAMVSVICNNALNASITDKNLSDPGRILDSTTEIVLNQFSKSEEEVKDGMDIGLCAFDKERKTLKYAGANIPLWLVRNGSVIEYKASRQPVGNYVNRSPFRTTEIKIENNDIIYLSSDGFADQFGGKRNKKYMKKKFKELLASIGDESIAIQNDLISTVFVDWKASNEQVDDICVMGIRINF